MTMTTIGILESTRDGGWAGQILLLANHVKIKLAPNDNQANAKAPAFRVFSGLAELGALWPHKTRDEQPQDFLSGEIDCPGLPEPVPFAVFFTDDKLKARVVWNKRKDERGREREHGT
jgi:uncharacterized protein (DUF736 family)